MITEKYEDKEFMIAEDLWEETVECFRKNLATFKKSHLNNFVTLFMPFTPIDLAIFLYNEIEHDLESYEWPLVVDKRFIDKHFKNFAVEICIVDEQEREMNNGNIIVQPAFVYEESNW